MVNNLSRRTILNVKPHRHCDLCSNKYMIKLAKREVIKSPCTKHVQYGLRETLCSPSVSLYCALCLYFRCASTCTGRPLPVLQVCLSLYCTPSACTSGVPQPVLHALCKFYNYDSTWSVNWLATVPLEHVTSWCEAF